MVWPTIHDVALSEYDAMELPGQQLLSANATTPLDHQLNLDVKAPPGCQRLTGIIASMGKSTTDVEVVEQMIAAGMNIALLNFSFGSVEEHIEMIKTIRQAAKNYSVKVEKLYPLAIAGRLTGKKIRTGRIADTYGDTVDLKTGETVRLTSDETYKDRCSTYTIFVDFMYLADQVKKGNNILLDNEKISLIVEVISSTTITCKIDRGGLLGSYKDVFIPNVLLNMPNFSEKDRMDIEMAKSHQLDILIAPFVSSAEAVRELKQILGEKGKKIAIVSQIQTIQGYYNFDDILAVTNGIIISRQELGSDITPKKLILVQKNMVARANKSNIPIGISTQLLSSMRYHSQPLRSELLDVANCVLDGADALVLTAETAVGQFPAETIACLAKTCKEAEACVWTRQLFMDMITSSLCPCSKAVAIGLATVLAAQRTLAAAIIVVTSTGHSAHIVSGFKPRCPIVAVTRYPIIAKQLHMWRGIIPLVYEDQPDPDWLVDVNQRVGFARKFVMERAFVRVGDPLVIVTGWREGSEFTETMRVVYATAD
ncbi:pyruvate kinase-like [Leguminivora glycinivorella]|uniref:pyruvate kinase-like n=1 Tax=Leguminivora glycinivorella TaxID=1035111 RepID=UPI00200F315B|nr:pyruvate kinase-like [Leguminivora glycinivorella]